MALALLVLTLGCGAGLAAEPGRARPLRVVVTIKPIHSLAAALLAGVAEPVLLVEGQASPHEFTLKPSAVRSASDADVLIRVAETVEPFTVRLVATLPASVEVVTLAALPGLRLLPVRTGATFEAHAHHAGHGDAHADHEHRHDDDAAAAAPRADSRIDGHIWLDPDNARRIFAAMSADFSRHDPDNSARIAANAAALTARIDALERDLAAELAPVKDRPFVVFHDAYQYLERRFDLAAVGAVTMSPEVQPSARRLSELRRRIAVLGAVCVFAEPQFQGGVVSSVVEGTGARSAVLDPEGALIEPGPELYLALMHRLADGMRDCLAASPSR